jgi:hypothetical protein
VTLVQSGTDTAFGRILPAGGASYTLEARLPDLSNPDDPTTLTANRLRAAGTDYPAALLATYTAIEPGTVGPETRALLAQIISTARPTTPYDTARAIESYLRDPSHFTYSTDVTNVDCGGRGLVDCFVYSSRGSCRALVTRAVARRSAATRRTPGSRRGSPALAGSISTRPGAVSASRSRSPPGPPS